jgi:hypothetical protein
VLTFAGVPAEIKYKPVPRMVGRPKGSWLECVPCCQVCVGGVPCCQCAHVNCRGCVKSDGCESYVDSGVEVNVVQSNTM